MPRGNCNHYWRISGPPQHRWWDGHAMAKCQHCQGRTIVEYKADSGVGPCEHSMGQMLARPYFLGEPPLEPEVGEGEEIVCGDCGIAWFDGTEDLDAWLAAVCDSCRERYNEAL